MAKKQGMSRRDFLKSTAAGAGLAALGLMGCSTPAESTSSAETTKAPETTQAPAPEKIIETVEVEKIGYEVIDAGDLLIIGSGMAAVAMARYAMAQGRHVTMIDKAPYGFGGASGYNWDIYSTVKVVGEHPEYRCNDGSSGLVNHNFVNAAVMFDPIKDNFALERIKAGQVLPSRNEDGTSKWYYEVDIPGYYTLRGVEGNMVRVESDVLKETPLLKVYDRTMATDFIMDGDRCVGVTGLYLPTGDFRAFRAKAVISATGGTPWFYGWTGVSAFTNSSADNTGDLDAAAYRKGCGLAHGEFPGFDFMTIEPTGLGYGWSTSIDADGNEPWLFCDKDGNQLWPDNPDFMTFMSTMDRKNFNQTIARKMLEDGIADEDGCITVNITGKHGRDYGYSTCTLLEEKFGIDPYQPLRTRQESYEHIACPIIDAQAMTELKGVFNIRGAGAEDPTSSQMGSGTIASYSAYVAQCALNYIDALEDAPVDLSAAEEEFARLEEIRTRKVENPLRPYEVRQSVQKLCGKVWGIIRNEADQAAAVEELARIRKEDLPRMCITSQSKTYNTEWKDAIEAYNLMVIAEVSVKASYERKESRGQYIYVEYPNQDDENWNCALVARQGEDGEVTLTKTYLNA